MPFERSVFIKTPAPFVRRYVPGSNPAPLFRRHFSLGPAQKAILRVCPLGYGRFWLNGQRVTEDLFIAPVSDYEKTLWYTEYDVTALLRDGENVLAAALGNGFFNEPFRSSWDHDKMPGRDNPKLLCELVSDGKLALRSGSDWLCTDRSPTTFNALRSGEHFDARRFDPDWILPEFDDSGWEKAVVARRPAGVPRLCQCEPIRECAVYDAVERWQLPSGRWVFDLGQNMMGYVRLKIKQSAGDVITIRYAERVDGARDITNGRMNEHYPESELMVDQFTCDGNEHTWSPMFAYHGFRYIALDGVVGEPEEDMVKGVFVHNDVADRGGFECSDPFVGELCRMGRMATLSNLAYMPTDCPTREKLGWANDAQASCEQFLTDFHMERLLTKWLQDIFDAQRTDGAMPGIIPTSGWGFNWGNGPVSDGILFELPRQLFQFTGSPNALEAAYPYMCNYLDYLDTRRGADGFVNFGLSDWAPPQPEPWDPPIVPLSLINGAYECKFLQIASMAASVCQDKEIAEDWMDEWKIARARYMAAFLNPDGSCKVDEQTALAMTIFHRLYDDLAPLKAQLLRLVEAADFHHNCGMVGLRVLYEALTICGAPEYAYRIITSSGYPSYRDWVDGGATALVELWQQETSYNHHMYSHFMSWLLKTVGGLRVDESVAGFSHFYINPAYIPELDWAKAHFDAPQGRISAEWRRMGDEVALKVSVPDGIIGHVKLSDGYVMVNGPLDVRFLI